MEYDEYRVPTICPDCGSENIVARVLYDKGITRYVCLDCGTAQSLPKEKNLKHRVNTTMAHWAQYIVKRHPFCVICGSTEDIEAHHIIPVSHSARFAYRFTNGITLCRKCHYLVHHKEEIDGV